MNDHPLLGVARTDRDPRRFLGDIGNVFSVFGAATQDSGNLSFGISVGDARFFVKTSDPGADAYLEHGARAALLRNAVAIAQSIDHPLLPPLLNVIESPAGPMLVYAWVDGELLGGGRDDPASAHHRFRRLPVGAVVAALDAIYELHVVLAAAGWVACDFYDGCLIYDFRQSALHVVDLDHYHRGAFPNHMGRMFGSSRFMAPEEFQHGASIDERTTVFNMGRAAAVFLADATLDRARFRGSDALHAVVVRACGPAPDDRFPTLRDFYGAWRRAT